MIPSEDSSAGKQRLGHISEQGNSLLRYLLSEEAQAAALQPAWETPVHAVGDAPARAWTLVLYS